MELNKMETFSRFSEIIGRSFVITDLKKMEPFTQGWRLGGGAALVVLRPGSLLEMWYVIKICVEADIAVLVQATNTGLTGGSTPNGADYDRPLAIVNTLRIDEIHLIKDATQFVALAGATLFELENKLHKSGREPHSVLGSSCIGASIVGGVCNNSGGALLQRGPAYTELALYAQVNSQGELELVNELDIDLGNTPEQILKNLQEKNYGDEAVKDTERLASDCSYHERVRDVNADTPARYNHNAERLSGASGCAGKIAVFAVRIDSYQRAKHKQVFYIGIHDTFLLETMRREILTSFKNLPASGEYVHRRVYDVTKEYGKDNFYVINTVGSKYIPKLFKWKNIIDRWATKLSFLSDNFSDRLMQKLSYLLPNHLPKRMEEYRNKYEHHWILETTNDGVEEARDYLESFFKQHDGGFFECSPSEGDKAMLHRFLAAGAISRYHMCQSQSLGQMISIDVALKRNEWDWSANSIDAAENLVADKFCYGHFFCHVLHQNYILTKGTDAKRVKQIILGELEDRGAEYPAEHNVGHEYRAKKDLFAHYQKLDPTNSFNPGVGQTSKNKNWN